jgi:Fe-S-cluster-containing hydrogenase component 2
MCEVACADFHYGAISPALSRIRVAKIEEIGIDVAVVCVGCAEKPCLECPTEALTVGELGQINLDEELCTGCEECVSACPIGAVGFHNDQPLFCDLCGGTPVCEIICPTQALYVEKEAEPSLAEFLEVEGTPAQKRVHYAKVQSEPVREKWLDGLRLGP